MIGNYEHMRINILQMDCWIGKQNRRYNNICNIILFEIRENLKYFNDEMRDCFSIRRTLNLFILYIERFIRTNATCMEIEYKRIYRK